MTIDLKTLKPGGKVDLTFKDGSRIVNAKLYKYGSSCLNVCNGSVTVVYGDRNLNIHIASVDAYIPPEPDWAAHRFCLVEGIHVWERTSDGLWWCHSSNLDKMSTEKLSQTYEGWIVALVIEKEESRPDAIESRQRRADR